MFSLPRSGKGSRSGLPNSRSSLRVNTGRGGPRPLVARAGRPRVRRTAVDTPARLIPARFPFKTSLLCGAAGAVFAMPQLQALLIFSRAAIDDGESWRLITGNLVHLSPSHFFCDVTALLLVGALIEFRGYRHFALLCLVSAAMIGATVYVGSPELSVFGGMSGIVMAAVTFLCLGGLNDTGAWR